MRDLLPAILVSLLISGQALAVCPALTTSAPRLYDGSTPRTLDGRDLDGDGNFDLVAGSTVLFGRGNGTFDAPVPIPAITGASTLFIADMNGDGRDDLIASKPRSGTSRYDIEILPNNGNRSFGPPVTVAPLALGEPLRIADVTNDGRPDMVLNANGQMVTLVNQGAFKFSMVTSGFPMAFGFAVADADNDGNVDLIGRREDYFAPTPLAVQRGNGRGGFPESWAIGSANDGATVVAADLDGDGRPELIRSYWSRNLIEISRLPIVETATPKQISSDAPGNVLAGDLNGDGDLDLVVAGNNGHVSTWLSDGHSDYTPGSVMALDDYATIAAVADFNGDHAADLVVRGFATTAILLGNGDGSFRGPRIIRATGEGAQSGVVLAADIDGDGIDELISTPRCTTPGPCDLTSDIFVGRAVAMNSWDFERLPLTTHEEYSESFQPIAATGDVAGDAQLEIIVGEGSTIPVFSRQGGSWNEIASRVMSSRISAVATIDHRIAFLSDGVLYVMTAAAPPIAVASFGPGYFVLRAADLDHDSRQDLLVTRSSFGDPFTGYYLWRGRVFVLRGLGDGAFAAPDEVYDASENTSHGGGILEAVTGDFNGDGNGDIAIATVADGVWQLHGDGKGAFTATSASPRSASMAAADIDGDGVTDLVLTDPSVLGRSGLIPEGLSLYRGTTTGLSKYGSWFTGRHIASVPVIARLRRGAPPALLTMTKDPGQAAVVDLDCRTRHSSVRH